MEPGLHKQVVELDRQLVVGTGIEEGTLVVLGWAVGNCHMEVVLDVRLVGENHKQLVGV